MNNRRTENEYTIRRQRASILFWSVVVVFAVTAFLALIALAIVIGLLPGIKPPYEDLFSKIVWALWGGVLAEGLAVFYALSRDLLGLKAEPKISELRNSLAEVIDGLESDGTLTEDRAEEVINSLGSNVATGGPVLRHRS